MQFIYDYDTTDKRKNQIRQKPGFFFAGVSKKKNTFIRLISDEDAEELEDKVLGKLMKKTRTGDLLSEKQKADFIEKLKAISIVSKQAIIALALVSAIKLQLLSFSITERIFTGNFNRNITAIKQNISW